MSIKPGLNDKAADQRAPVPMRLSANGQSIISTSPFSEEYIAESLTVAEVCVEVCVAFAARTGGEANALINLVLPTGLIRMLHMLTAVRRLRRLSADFAGLGSNQRFKSSTENAKRKRARTRRALYSFGTPYRIRTGVTAVRGRRPKPLDEGSGVFHGPVEPGALLYGPISNAQAGFRLFSRAVGHVMAAGCYHMAELVISRRNNI